MSSPRAHEEVAERARESAELLGDNPAEAVLAKVSEVLAIIDSLDDSAPVTTSIGAVRLIDYLPTRVLEIVVHTLDVARLAGLLKGGLELGTAIHRDGPDEEGHAGDQAVEEARSRGSRGPGVGFQHVPAGDDVAGGEV